ncbi:MAG TPA: hypothetical protein VFA83_21995 [Acidimicrobiales bacterium]|nr:hypothetical protein [Acidimicrobiales bacterium]
MSGSAGDSREALLDAFAAAREAGDGDAMTRIALRLPSLIQFGTHPGALPALVHEAYVRATAPVDRARLATALARTWAYGGDFGRAAEFATEAVATAESMQQPAVLADALDALLLVRWSPDDFDERRHLAARLDDTVAHVVDPEVRLSAHLWRLTTAWECLDAVAVQRQLRALDLLAEESRLPRMAFYAAARRTMQALVVGDLEQADELHARTRAFGEEAGEIDLLAVDHSLTAARARQTGDVELMRAEAPAFEEFGTEQGVQSIAAEGAVLWVEAGRPDHARRLLHQLVGAGLDTVARDVDFLLTVTSLVHVAAVLGDEPHITEDGLRLLAPYAGRGALNGGAVMFQGVVDEYLYEAARALGRDDATRHRHAAESAYRRIGAQWWERRLASAARTAPTPSAAAGTVHLQRDAAGTFTVGREGATVNLPDLKGLHHLRALVQRPGVDVAALDLVAAVEGHPGETVASDAGATIDAQALAAYRTRLRDIDAELDEAVAMADAGRTERLQAERDALLDEVKAATGLGDRRRTTGSTAERARVTVRKAIASAIARIEPHDAALARLLRDTVHTGGACRYDPDPTRPVSWLT